MKRKRITTLLCGTIIAFGFIGCVQDSINEIVPKPEITIPISPKSIAEIKNQNEIELIRNIAEMNDFAEDFSSDDPSQWEDENLKLIWQKGDDSLFILTEIEGGNGIKTLEIIDSENTFTDLTIMKLRTPQLSTLSLSQLPALETLVVDGKEGENLAPIEKIHLSQLEHLESLTLRNLPKLTKSNNSAGIPYWDNEVKFLEDYGYPMLNKVEIEQTGITNFYLSAEKTVNLKFVNNTDIEVLSVENAIMPQLRFDAEQYSKLTNLKLTHLSENSDETLDISNLGELSDITITDAPGLSNIVLSGTPKVNRLDISKTNISTIGSETLSQLEALVRLNLTHSQVANIDLSTLPNTTKFDLTYNQIVSTADIQFPKKVTEINLSGNPINFVDLRPYEALKSVAIIGYDRKTEELNPENPNSLNEFHLGKADGLYSLNLKNNSLAQVLNPANSYPKLEQINLSHNPISPLGFAEVLTATKSAVNEGYIGWSDGESFTIFPLRPFHVDVTDNQINLKKVVDLFKKADLEEFEISIYKDGNEYPEDKYTYNSREGIVKFTESGTYKMRIKIEDPELFRLFIFDNFDSAPFNIQL